jgi:hypothetical protein
MGIRPRPIEHCAELFCERVHHVGNQTRYVCMSSQQQRGRSTRISRVTNLELRARTRCRDATTPGLVAEKHTDVQCHLLCAVCNMQEQFSSVTVSTRLRLPLGTRPRRHEGCTYDAHAVT